MSINKVMISGNTTRDAELRATAGGTPVLNFGVAVNERRRNAHNEWEDYANFIDCAIFGRRAEALAQYLTKGTKVAIEGRLHYSSWEDRNNGGRRSKLEVYVDELEFLSSKASSGNGANRSQSHASHQPDVSQAIQDTFPGAAVYDTGSIPPAAYDDSDIPF